MNTKYFFAAGAIATVLSLSACGNSNNDNHSDNKTKNEDTNIKTDTSKHLTGTFSSKNGEKVEGKAEIKDGKLMLTDYKSSKGPDLHVYLTKNGDIKNGKEISTVDYDKKTQTFDLKHVDLNKYNEVTIYCKKAHVIFGGAKLK
ncbi:DM13 domain-containing protein [Staphylococcus simiae]|uniref:DM13 domain-containing protein n=1 Tax=Staphylococcus simiae TaxID=308354 RepID=UPI001A971590|nr:DM13 domain-containing protein [Staphylococcus simiae]MBO1199991.1 DM13 domain-containing protein [Staphylococcus simiae]MBO1200755.1 DM13 domain-containing protein [Staphylococcus simiae]MBO1204527.1 DM13 domain-containing protein [Staphylococcus simiae]MBO1210561.1 DM13 domain-containing protein [Staphylococcus simiae]MBO1229091.1 DM13 domain-containing protein [Staphylococcus simiae]